VFHRVSASKVPDGLKHVAERIQGNWAVVRMGSDGKLFQSGDKGVMRITANKMLMDGGPLTGIYELDPNHQPGWIDVQDIRTPDSLMNRKLTGSYILDGDSLTIVLRGSNSRASDFVAEGNRYFFYLKRIVNPIDEILGDWTMMNTPMEGGSQSKFIGPTTSMAMTITKEKLIVKSPWQTVLEATWQADPYKRPKWIDLTDINNNQTKMKGLYVIKFDGAKLELVFDKSGQRGRPSAFTSELGTANDIYWIFNRADPKSGLTGNGGLGGKKGGGKGKGAGFGGIDDLGSKGTGGGKGTAAKSAKGRLAFDSSIEALANAIESPDARARAEAIAELHRLSARVERIAGKRAKPGDEHAPKVPGLTPHLAKAATDPTEANRVAALFALADTLDIEATVALRDRLSDPSKKVRFLAACLLTEFQVASGLAELKKTLHAVHANLAAAPLADIELLLLAMERITGKTFGEIPAAPAEGPGNAATVAQYHRLVDNWTAWWDWAPAKK
jgi:uncharacterized protein (TIGR03067 family)